MAPVALWQRACFACKRHGFESRQLHFFIYYFTWNANRPSGRAGMSASAELLISICNVNLGVEALNDMKYTQHTFTVQQNASS